jgi:3-methylcrotonyl-CoA carboxylase alpha subunit
MSRYRYRLGETTYGVELKPAPDGGWIALIDGVRYSVTAQAAADGGLRLVIDGVAARAYTAAEGDKRHVWMDGEAATLEVVRGSARKPVLTQESGRVTAGMPGQVRALLVSVGDAVTRGQPLLILEAMKMELRVTAPADGRVRALHVALGALVERGALLVEID